MRAFERAALAREQGNIREADYWQGIADLVAAAPPLTQSQRDQLRVLLRPDPEPQPRPTAA